NGRETYGHSLVIDPWGRILAEGGTEPGVFFADVDPAEVAAARGRRPPLQHGRRFEVIEPLAEPTHLPPVGEQEGSVTRSRARPATISRAGSAIPTPTTSSASAAS